MTGKLLEHGPAHYQFDESKPLSYFVKVQTAYGPQVKWGVDLDRAFAASKTQPQIGDEIGVELLGARPVTVRTDVLDQAGRVTRQREATKHRNSWVVEKREYFEQRAQRAKALRDERRSKEDLARDYPELAGALATVQLAELFAAKNLSTGADRDRFVKLVRDSLARVIEHEVAQRLSLPAPNRAETPTEGG